MLDGHSLRPFLKDPEASDWTGPPVALMAIRNGKATPHFSVCSSQYRYTRCANGEEELYDHNQDPHEWTNLATNQAFTSLKKELKQQLMHQLKESKMPSGYKG